ncbi:agmatinase family protein [Alkalihalobacillus pseudalcaliphilus]|uniref:agmatinase family protein n=1 Tax=Alkalihalobacillus pseudalcaliphilus TaxID=79884 RepID=UPI00064DE799|nr:agmatinase family protein [Alkalihalobacillus pseudalcaliphilus]KMK77720.1 formimidoylglutamase [Alkalihalobacillus pseudalcaliphilus]
MSNYPYPLLNQPPFTYSRNDNVVEPKAHEWIRPIDDEPSSWKMYDAVILGIPLSRSSISASYASENPEAFRRTWKSFSTYNLDEDIDLSILQVADLGDVKEHITDIQQCHQNIRDAMKAIQTYHPQAIPISIGGDHSITAMLVRGYKDVYPNERVGILQFDTHFDLRDPKEIGPANGTPIRQLIEDAQVLGEDVYNIGLHGFFNAKSLKQYADEAGLHYITMKQARKKGIEETVRAVVEALNDKVDKIYMTVDMDVLDVSVAPGAPVSTPGGMYVHELLEAVQVAGEYEKVFAMDIVCLDPQKDVAMATVKTGVHVMLSFLTGKMVAASGK